MDRAVFDSDVLVRYSKGEEGLRNVVAGVAERYISLVTWIEFLVGFSVGQRETYQNFLKNNFTIVPCGYEIAELVVDIRQSTRLKLPDATIYATAKYVRAPLVTFNTKDFDESAPDIYVPYR